MWWQATLISFAVLALTWLALLALLALFRPDAGTLRQMPRVLPDTVRLVRRLAADRTIPRSAGVPVWLLLGYLVMPLDLVPDVLPVIGYADDAILTVLVLRHLTRGAGPGKLAEHWPGSAEGLSALRRMLRLPRAT